MAYSVYQHYDFSYSPDASNYLRMATGQFDIVRITRRYRALVQRSTP
ncbi:hypothetical protein [Hymenobacter sp. PAMC 26628]|nr:hypothetical protein [Hymenobacter sp. PAMC 26628]